VFIYHFNRLIRSRILWGFFAIIIAIAFVSVDSCFRGPKDALSLGRLNGKKITADEFDQAVQAVRGFGRNRNNEMSASVAERRAWERLAARQIADLNGLTTGKEEIREALREVPAFQGPNGFDMTRYRYFLAEQGVNPAFFESFVAHQITLRKCAALVESASWVSPMEIEDELAAMTDRFTVQFAQISNRFAGVEMRLTDDDYRKFYEENKNSFALPDRVSVRYIAIPVSNYLDRVSVAEDDLQEYYDSHIDTYKRTTTNDTTETIPYAEVRDKILDELKLEEAKYCAATSLTFAVYGKAEGSNVLEAVAAQVKLPVKTSPLFGMDETLYWTDNSKEFAAAAFELDPSRSDSRYGIVKGDVNVFVIEQDQTSPAHTPTYEAVLDDLKPRAQAKARSEAFQSYAKELRADLRKLLDEGKSFAEAAQAKALNVSTSVTYTVSDIQNARFDHSYSVAYGAMTLKKGELSEVIPATASLSLIVHVQDRQPGDALSAEMMRSQIRAGIARRRGNLVDEWLAWNLSKQDFHPKRPLADGDEEPSITSDEDEDADAPKSAKAVPAKE